MPSERKPPFSEAETNERRSKMERSLFYMCMCVLTGKFDWELCTSNIGKCKVGLCHPDNPYQK
jgi:hypothetical protein